MATGDSLITFDPRAHEPLAANSAGFDTRNQHPVLDFDDTTKQFAVFSAVMPQTYVGTTGVTVKLHYAMSSAVTGDIDWDVEWERIGDQQLDIDGDSFAAANSVDATTVPGTSGLVDVVTITFTDGVDMDSVVKGESFRLRVSRDSPNDSASGDAELVKVEVLET